MSEGYIQRYVAGLVILCPPLVWPMGGMDETDSAQISYKHTLLTYFTPCLQLKFVRYILDLFQIFSTFMDPMTFHPPDLDLC